MSCQGKSKTVGLAVDYAPGVVAVAHHGCPDAAFDAAMQRFTFADTEAVIAGLADRTLPLPVRREMLRNLAMNNASSWSIAHLFLDGEAYQYARYQGVQELLAWAKLPPKTDPKEVKELRLDKKRIHAVPEGIGEFANLTILS
jgi:hypothetical protein